MGDPSSEREEGKNLRSLNAVLGEVVHIHDSLMRKKESEIERLKKQVQDIEKEKASIQEGYATLQEKYDGMTKEKNTVIKKLEERNNEPCAKCRENQQKVRTTEKLHKNLFKMLKKSVAGSGSLDADTLFTQLTEECTEQQPELAPSTGEIRVSSSSMKEASSGRAVLPSGGDNVVVVSDGSEGACSQDKTKSKKGKKDINKVVKSSAKITESEKAESENKDEISPNGMHRLKLAKTAKRARTRYTEEPMPSFKRHCPPVGSQEFKKPEHVPPRPFETDKTLPVPAPSVSPDILVSETLEPEYTFTDESKNARERRKGVVWRPNIVIPETVPMDFDNGQDESDSQHPEESNLPESVYIPTQISYKQTQNSLAHVAFSPPSYTSTPATFLRTNTRSDPNASPLKVIFTEMSDDNVSSQSERHVDMENDRLGLSMNVDDERGARLSMKSDSEDSMPSSPVFGHAKEAPVTDSPVQDSPIKDSPVSSPQKFTLTKPDSVSFSEDEQQTKEESSLATVKKGFDRLHRVSVTDMPNQSGQRSSRQSLLSESNTSVQSNPSPSVLSGKIISLTSKHSESSRVSQTSQGSGRTLSVRSKRSPTRLKLRSTKALVDVCSEDGDSWLSTKWKSSGPRLKQTTLSQFPFATKAAYSPAKDDVQNEDEDLERAKEASLKEYQEQEEVQRKILASYVGENSYNSTTNTKGQSNQPISPKFKKPLSPQKPTTPKRGKKPLEMMENIRKSPRLNKVRSDSDASSNQTGPGVRGSLQSLQGSSIDLTTITGPRELNGTIDPGVRLSQYDTPQEDSESLRPASLKSQYLEPVSVLEMHIQAEEDEMVENSPPCRPKRSLRSIQGSSVLQRSNNSQSNKRASGKKSTKGKETALRPQSPPLEVIEDNLEESSMQSAVFGSTRPRLKPRSDNLTAVQEYEGPVSSQRVADFGPDMSLTAAVKQAREGFNDSFDRVPKKKEPDYAYKEVVRKQSDRRQLDAKACIQCDNYFSDLGLDEAEKRERMKNCRHKAKYLPPDTPEHFWSVGFPDTQECQERGTIHTAETKPSKFRRKRGFKALFLEEKDKAKSSTDNDSD